MRIEYDQKADALYIYVQEKKYVSHSQEIGEGTIVDLDKQGNLIGLEVLDVSKKYKNTDLTKYSIKDLVNSHSMVCS